MRAVWMHYTRIPQTPMSIMQSTFFALGRSQGLLETPRN